MLPVQDHGREPNSDDELRLMGEVESLQSQLRKKGETFSERIENIFIQSLASKRSISPWFTETPVFNSIAVPADVSRGLRCSWQL